jgi:hypothetical protein
MTKAPAWNVSSAGRRPTGRRNAEQPDAERHAEIVTEVHSADCVRPKPNRVDR